MHCSFCLHTQHCDHIGFTTRLSVGLLSHCTSLHTVSWPMLALPHKVSIACLEFLPHIVSAICCATAQLCTQFKPGSSHLVACTQLSTHTALRLGKPAASPVCPSLCCPLPASAYKQDIRLPVPPLQGPPGTGKTKTILALLSLILYAKPSSQKSGQNGAAAELSVTQAPSQTELQRLWKAASPWITGDNPRWVSAPLLPFSA